MKPIESESQYSHLHIASKRAGSLLGTVFMHEPMIPGHIEIERRTLRIFNEGNMTFDMAEALVREQVDAVRKHRSAHIQLRNDQYSLKNASKKYGRLHKVKWGKNTPLEIIRWEQRVVQLRQVVDKDKDLVDSSNSALRKKDQAKHKR